MKHDLILESEKLTRSWAQHQAAWLRDYLVAGVEDPRINIQSILSRHFLIHELAGERFAGLMQQEYRFSAVMDWCYRAARLDRDLEGRAVTLHAIKKGSDNAEGLEIPPFLLQTFAQLPAVVGPTHVPNYIEAFLSESIMPSHQSMDPVLDTFSMIWKQVLANALGQDLDSVSNQEPCPKLLSVLEPACGSANDFRFWHQYGIAALCQYCGFDLCVTNIKNARTLFPDIRFEEGNVFEIPGADKQFDVCIVHDLFEHLSLAGLEQAVAEICRVTRKSICAGFFQMDEIPEHIVRPTEDYHWNLLSMAQMKRLFASHGFAARALHIGSFLSAEVGCRETHNQNAYTFLLKAD